MPQGEIELPFPDAVDTIMRQTDSSTQEETKNNILQTKYLENTFQNHLSGPPSVAVPVGVSPTLPMPTSNELLDKSLTNPIGQGTTIPISNPHEFLHSATTADLQSVTNATQAANTTSANTVLNSDTTLPEAIVQFRKENGYNPKAEAAFVNRFEMNEKIRILTTIQEYKKRGQSVQPLTVNNTLLDLKTELERVRRVVEIDASVTSYKSMLMFFVVGAETLNKFSRKKLNLDRWSESFQKYDLPKCELLLFQIAEQEKTLMGPKSLLFFTVFGSAFFFHFSQGMSTELGKIFGTQVAGNIMDAFAKNPTKFMDFFSGNNNNTTSSGADSTKATAQERVVNISDPLHQKNIDPSEINNKKFSPPNIEVASVISEPLRSPLNMQNPPLDMHNSPLNMNNIASHLGETEHHINTSGNGEEPIVEISNCSDTSKRRKKRKTHKKTNDISIEI